MLGASRVVLAYLGIPSIEGADSSIVFRGGRPQGDGYEKGNFINATILVDVPDDSRMVTEEVFMEQKSVVYGLV